MSALKDQDPDYGPSNSNDTKHQRIYEENARSNTARKITAIIEKEFSQEVNVKEKEILEIQQRLHRTSKILHLLRYVIVADFYNRKQCQTTQNVETKQTQIHPAIKQLIGKSPRSIDNSTMLMPSIAFNDSSYFTGTQDISTSSSNVLENTSANIEKLEECSESGWAEKRRNDREEELKPRKIPRYIPPKSEAFEFQSPSRGISHKARKRIIIGNISKWIPPEWREDAASHKWTMYVRGNKENPDIDDFVSKVRFFLHPSYRPNDVIEVTSAPFCLSRRGWGEFPLRVQMHFKNALNKPMDIIHHLKLDRTYTGLQTLGSETLVDIWIYADSKHCNRNIDRITDDPSNEAEENDCKVKQENVEDSNIITDHFCNDPYDSLKLSDRNFSVAIKEEPLDDMKIDNDRVHLKMLQFYVELDHDYCGSKFLNNSGGNLTIDHSLTVSKSTDPFANEIKNKAKSNDLENGDISRLKSEDVMNDSKADLFKEYNGNTCKVLPLSCSKFRSDLRPLEITIPPLFEPSKNKHVLVLQNCKKIPAFPSTDNADNDSRKSKTISATAPGVSLLKKSLCSDIIVQTGNTNGIKPQQEIKLQSSKSIFLQINSNVPVLQIAERRSSFNDVSSGAERGMIHEQLSKQKNEEFKPLRQKITLGKDKHKFVNRKEFYEEIFQNIETVNITSVEGLLRFIIKRMPMITKNAEDPDYRSLHPYACENEEEFFSYSVPKRNACEWNRAKMIRSFMTKKSFKDVEIWSVKEIIIWSRLHGYTPLNSDFSIRLIKSQKNLPDPAVVKCISSITLESEVFLKWLQNCPAGVNDQLQNSNAKESEATDVELDVVSVDIPPKKERRRGMEENYELSNNKMTVLELEDKLIPLHNFVYETAREIGVKLIPEEIVPNVLHCAASRMIMKAVECLVEDMVRMSLAKSWERSSDNGYPKVIVLDDVREALLNREEFDVFTNKGLGSKYRLMTME